MIKPIKNIKSLLKFDIFKIVNVIYSKIDDYKTDILIDKVFYNTPDLIYIQD